MVEVEEDLEELEEGSMKTKVKARGTKARGTKAKGTRARGTTLNPRGRGKAKGRCSMASTVNLADREFKTRELVTRASSQDTLRRIVQTRRRGCVTIASSRGTFDLSALSSLMINSAQLKQLGSWVRSCRGCLLTR